MSNIDFEKIDNPYDYNLNRANSDIFSMGGQKFNSEGLPRVDTSEDKSSDSKQGLGAGSVPGGNPTVPMQEDLWISNWIKSRCYKPKSQGFLIDGKLGYIECMKLYVGTGGIIGGKIDIPDDVSADSFHTNLFGNSWWGCNVADFNSDNENAKAYVLKTGVAKFTEIFTAGGASNKVSWDKTNFDVKGVRYIQSFTAGETITAPKVVCYKKAVTDTAQDGANGISKDCMTDSSDPTTNFDSGNSIDSHVYSVGSSAGVIYNLFYGFNVSNSQPDKVLLRFRGNVQQVGTLEVYRVTADWTEADITHNTIPATTTVEGTGVPTKTLTATGWQWIELDITNIVKGEMYNNIGNWTLARGIRIQFTGNVGYITNIASTEYTQDATLRPFLRITKGIDLDTELYVASSADINLARKIVGMNITDGSDGNAFNVQFGGVVSGLSGLTAGQEYWLSTAGIIDNLNNLTKVGGILTKIGVALSTTTLRLEIEPERFLWKAEMITLLANAEVNYVFAPIEANECVIHYNVEGGNGSGTVVLKRKGLNTIAVYPSYDLGGGNMLYMTYTWDDTNNKITITNSNTSTVDTNHTLYFYK